MAGATMNGTKRTLPALTGPELDVMKALWRAGDLGAREVHDRVGPRHDWAYSTTRTTLERLVKKDLVAKRDFHGLFVYSPAISKPRGLAGMVREFAERVLETDYAPVVSLFAESEALTPDEIAELESILESATTTDTASTDTASTDRATEQDR